MYTNVDNSLLGGGKYDELKVIMYEKQLEIVALTEIKPKNGKIADKKLLEVPGYELYTNDLEEQETRGVCIYVHKSIKSVPVLIPGTNKFKDSVWIKLYEPGNDRKNTLIGCIYRSGTPSTAEKNDIDLHHTLRTAAELPGYAHRVIMGDFNLNKITWDPEPSIPTGHIEETTESKFIDCIQDTYLYQHVIEPTRYRDGHTPTRDDLIFTSEDNFIDEVIYAPAIGASDHITLQFTVNLSMTMHTNREKVYLYDKGDYPKLNEMLSNVNWKEELNSITDINEAISILDLKIHSVMNECIPRKEIRSSSLKGKPIWMDMKSMRSARKKHSTWIRYLNTKSGHDYEEFRKARNKANHAVRRARRRFERSIAKECKMNNKAFWKYVNSRRKTRPGISKLKKKDKTYTTNDKEAAEILSDQYFETLTRENTENMPTIEEHPLITEALQNIEFTEEAVYKVLAKMKTDKSPGLDGMHPRVLKEAASSLKTPIAIIFNLSMNLSKLPTIWLDAVITPIFKKGDRTDPANYRPVSLTSILCKCMEKIIVEHIIKHLRKNSLECPEQHGFRTGRSTVTNLLEALNVWTEALMHDLPVDVIFLDYAKAFDTVPHKRLLSKVSSMGIKGKALDWIKAFLTDRRQKVRVHGETSNWRQVLSGVPQGTVLGPILFTIFVADVPGAVESIVSMFADDTKMYAVLVNNSSAHELDMDISKLQVWSDEMQMKFHIRDKCKVMHLGKSNTRHDYTMVREDGTLHTLTKASEEKDLGVTIDDKLKFDIHISNIIKKANKVLGAIRHTFHYMDKEIFLMLYKSLVRPHLEYATCVWSPHLKQYMNALENVQRRATRLVPEFRNLNYDARLKELKLPTLMFRRKRADMLQTFKLMHSIDTMNLNTRCQKCNNGMLNLSHNEHTRGHALKLLKPKTTGVRSHFFATRIINDWNKLSSGTVFALSVNDFKKGLREDWANDPDQYHYGY